MTDQPRERWRDNEYSVYSEVQPEEEQPGTAGGRIDDAETARILETMLASAVPATPGGPAGSYTLSREMLEQALERYPASLRRQPITISPEAYVWGRKNGVITDNGRLDLRALDKDPRVSVVEEAFWTALEADTDGEVQRLTGTIDVRDIDGTEVARAILAALDKDVPR